MLFYKFGTLSEDRFKNLTPLQWLFHYQEIKQHINKLEDIAGKLVEMYVNRSELQLLATDREFGRDLLELKKQDKMKQEDKVEEPVTETNPSSFEAINNTPLSDVNFPEQWGNIMKFMPKELKVDTSQQEKKFELPKFSRSQLRERVSGIQISPK